MGYDDVKTAHDGRTYTGMRVGGVHDWTYPEGWWRERKVAPDRWEVRFASRKERRRPAPEGSGAPVGTMYHWLLVGHQRVLKTSANTYTTLLEGQKWKIGHKRPKWRAWSTEYPDAEPARERAIHVLEGVLAELRAPARGARSRARFRWRHSTGRRAASLLRRRTTRVLS